MPQATAHPANPPARTLWAAARTERAALAEDLATLDDAQWRSASLCAGWSVEQVVAHLTAAASLGPVRWLASVIGARFDFDLHNQRRLDERLGPAPADTLARFRSVITSAKSAPGPVTAWLGEVVVHAEDIRRPLGLTRAYPTETVTAVAEFYARRDLAVRSHTTARGLRLEASDGPFTAGDGDDPLVSGTTLALIMAMAGRAAYCDELSGPGAPLLRARLSPPAPAGR